MFVEIIPHSTRAKNRIKEHGPVMRLIRDGAFKGEQAFLVESLFDTFENSSMWIGWFTFQEASYKCVTINVVNTPQ
jgi:hypothetical protein